MKICMRILVHIIKQMNNLASLFTAIIQFFLALFGQKSNPPAPTPIPPSPQPVPPQPVVVIQPVPQPLPPPHITTGAKMIQGIDVSQVQGTVDFQAVAASGIQFVFCRCGVGNDGSDTHYATNIANAQAAGLHVGCYHFVYPLPPSAAHPGHDPQSQAQAHFAAAKGINVVSMDLEWPAPEDWTKWSVDGAFISDWGLKYLEAYEQLSGVKPLVYTYPYFASAVKLSADYANYSLWVASYEATPAAIAPWGQGNWSVWQVTGGKGRLPGSGAPVDTDVVRDLSLWNQ